MSLHFILGSSGSGKTYTLYHKIITKSLNHPDQNYLIIVPEQFTLQTQKDLVNMHERKGIMNIDVLSFLRLAFRVFEETGGKHQMILEDTGKSMIVKKIVLQKKNELHLFGSNVRKQGFIDELKSMISEFYQYSIGITELNEMIQLSRNKRTLYYKLLDIKTIYEGFIEFLQKKYITNEEIFEVLGEAIEKSEFVCNSIVCLDGYTGFTPSQYKLIRSLIRYAKEVYVTVTIDQRALQKKQLEHELFYISSVTMDKLRKIAAEEKKDVYKEVIGEISNDTGVSQLNSNGVLYRYRDSKALAYLESNLFRYPYKVFTEEQEDVFIYAANDRLEEVEYTAITIKKLVREKGYRYRDIAIVSGDVTGYGALVRRKLEEIGIPCFIDEKETIIRNPLSELIKGLLSLIQYDYTYETVFHVLRTGLLSWELDEIDILENYIIRLGIKGRYRWKNEWKRKYRTSYEVPLEEINRLRVKFLDMISPLDTVFLRKDATVKELMTALFYFLREQQIEEKLFAFAKEQKKKKDIESKLLAKEYEQVYRLVLEVFDRITELLGEDILPLNEFREIMETGLSEAEVGLIPPGTDQILVGDIERTRLKDIKILFFVGVNDGIIPKANVGGGILSEMDRQFLFEHDIELAPTMRQNAFMTDFYLYLNLTKPQNKLYISYFKVDMDGKTARPSPLIYRLFHLFEKLKFSEKAEDVLGIDKGMTYLAKTLRNYEKSETLPIFYELYQLYIEELGRKEEAERLLKAAFYERCESGIQKEAAILLYGNSLLGSVTRMEHYASCAFSHFLLYGLSLEERTEYQVTLPDIGNIYHLALEKFANKLKYHNLTWHSISEEERIKFGKESVLEATSDFSNGILESSSRNAYLVKKVERVLQRTTKTIKEQLEAGVFEPEAYEYNFLHADKFLNLRGRIDRLDLHEENGKVYVQVVDYKTGSEQFELESLYYGLQLQLGVYLIAGLRYVNQGFKGKSPIPAGAFYYNIDDPIVEKSESAGEEIQKKLAMKGIANASPNILAMIDKSLASESGLLPSKKSSVILAETNGEGELTKNSSVASNRQFKTMLDFVNNKMFQLSHKIMEGDTSLNPYKLGEKTACDYCNFSSVCGFDIRLPGSSYHKLTPLGDDDAWIKMAEDLKKEEGLS